MTSPMYDMAYGRMASSVSCAMRAASSALIPLVTWKRRGKRETEMAQFPCVLGYIGPLLRYLFECCAIYIDSKIFKVKNWWVHDEFPGVVHVIISGWFNISFREGRLISNIACLTNMLSKQTTFEGNIHNLDATNETGIVTYMHRLTLRVYM